MSTPDETYRATMQVQTPENGKATLIITFPRVSDRLGFGEQAWVGDQAHEGERVRA